MADRHQSRFLDRSTPPHIITLVLIAGLSALSMNIFLPSLPNMTTYFQTDYALMQLSVSAYLAVNAVLQLFVGPISDRFGRRPVILWGYGLFLLATIGCLLATSIEVFLIFRMSQGAIVTGMVLSRAIVRDMVPAAQAASMIGYVTMGMAVVPMVGPAVGGYLDELFGWQANFSMLLFLGVAVMALVWADLGETNKSRSTSMLAQIRDYPELFRSRRFWGYSLAAAFSSGSFFAFIGGAPYIATEFFGLKPGVLGVYFGMTAFGYMAGNFISGRFSTRVGVNRMILFGTLVIMTGMSMSLILFLSGAGHPLVFFGFMSFVGIGNGMSLPNANAGMLSVRPHLAGTASGLGGAIMISGGAALSALSGAILSPTSGPFPLIWLIIATAVLAVVTILYIMKVERSTGPLDVEVQH